MLYSSRNRSVVPCGSVGPRGARPLSRRGFLKSCAFAGAALLGATTLGGCADRSNKLRMGWWAQTDSIAPSYLWSQLLSERGYEVEMIFADQGPVFEGVAGASLDFALDAWSPLTHKAYLEKYQDDFDLLDPWYRTATLNWTVPSYVPIDSIDQIAENAGLFGNRIVGIEPGAGLTDTSRNQVIPDYGLEDMDFVDASTTAMLSELDRSISREEPIVVTLWHPHWAYATYDLKDLADPKGSLGFAESLIPFVRLGFTQDYPDVVRWLNNFELTDAQFSDLQKVAVEDAGIGHEDEGVRRWLDVAENRALADSWID